MPLPPRSRFACETTGEACRRPWLTENTDRHRLSRTHTDEVTNDGYRPPTMPHHRGKPSSLQSPTHLPPVRPHVQSPGALRSHPPSLTHTPIQPAPSYVQTPLPPPSLPDSERNVEAGWRVAGYGFAGGRGARWPTMDEMDGVGTPHHPTPDE